MKFDLVYLIPVLLMWVACSSPQTDYEADDNGETPEAAEGEETYEYPEHSARTALDYLGAYEGVVPCDTCEGVLMRINLYKDDEYRLQRTFLGVSDEINEYKGSFIWNEEGNTITFDNIDPPNKFLVTENRLVLLDEDGEKYTGEDKELYHLPKRR
jgi:uncharacterized lipoprotein NlpE involved in copper resistance